MRTPKGHCRVLLANANRSRTYSHSSSKPTPTRSKRSAGERLEDRARVCQRTRHLTSAGRLPATRSV